MLKFVVGLSVAAFALVNTAGADSPKGADAKSLDGTWTVVSYEKNGEEQAGAQGMTVKADNGTITCSGKDGKPAMTMKVVFGPNGTVQINEAGPDASTAATSARAGVYVLTQNMLAISVNEEATAETKAVDGQGGKARCNVVLKRESSK